MPRIAIVCTLVWAACSSPAPAVSPAVTCSAAAHPADRCSEALTFAAGPNVTAARDHHGSLVATIGGASFLYVTGGTNYHRVFADVLVAPLGSDGSVGAWTATTPIPDGGRAGHGIVAHAGRLILVAGQNNGSFPPGLLSAPIHADGTLGDWVDGPSLPLGRFHAAAVVDGDFLYVLGGVDPSFDATATVYRATLASDGSIGDFVALADLPGPRSHHSAVAYQGWLYLAAGLSGNPMGSSTYLPDVLSAPIGADGSLGDFTTVATLDPAPVTHSSFVRDGQLYIVGGLDSDLTYLDTLRAAPLGPNGAVGAFATLPSTLPYGRSHVHQTPLAGDHFYTIGGSTDYQVVSAAVNVGTFAWQPRAAALTVLAPHPLVRGAPHTRNGAHCQRF